MTRLAASFLAGVVLMCVPQVADAAPATVAIGSAQATLVLNPDPPRVGREHAVVTLSGVSSADLARTTASFATLMPSMSMTGPSGSIKATAPGRFEFDAMLGMASAWDITLKFSGGVSGTATYHVVVQTAAAAAAAAAASRPNSAADASAAAVPQSANAMAGMSTSGDPGAWRTATFALVITLIVGLFAVLLARRDRRPLTLGITIAAALVILGFAVIQTRYAAPAMDMAAMSSVQGEAPIPVTFAAVQTARDDARVFAPGTIAPYLMQDVVTRAPGILRDFSAYAGDRVRAGQIIATLDAPDLQSRAQAATADAAAQADAARAADIEAHHHAPNGVVIANAQTAATQSDLSAAQSERSAKAEQARYWQNEVRRESSLLAEGAVSQQEYQDERAQAAAAQAALDAASQRIASLQQQLVASHTKAMDAVASVSQMQAQAAAAQAQALRSQANARTESTLASYTTVTSPSDATVMKRLVDPGVYVQAGTPIARIAVIDRLRVQANVAQSDLAGISEGTPIDVTLGDGTLVHGRVASVAPVADPATHTASVEAIVGSAHTKLVPGGFVRVTFHTHAASVAGGTHVPSAAVVGSGADAAVWIAVRGTAHRVPVRVVSDNGAYATVTGHLGRGTRVVIDGAPTLEEGQAIAEQRS